MRQIVLKQGENFNTNCIDRSGAFDADALIAATQIIQELRERKDDALRDFSLKFDGVEVGDLRVSDQEIEDAYAQIPEKLRKSLHHAAAQIKDFHARQVQQTWLCTREDGAVLGSQVTPVQDAGIYVPGGRALYPSSVLMNAIPAKVAGVPRIVCTTPPQKDGSVDAGILAACKIAGVTEVYKVGGAQAIGALAYGTQSIDPVSKITGPGNAYVAAAKKIVSGDVGIDMIAGPSEVCVVADSSASTKLVAIDLMAQAEHDPLAACYLVCFSEDFAGEVLREIDLLLAESPRCEITKASLDNHGLIVVCPDITSAFDTVNIIAPEHLEIQIENAFDYLPLIKNAGAIFFGRWSAEAIGDYVAGPNHTLPTGGTARFSSPLSVDDFIKKTSIIKYSSDALKNDASAIRTIATHEGLWAHAKSVEIREEMLQASVLENKGEV